MSAEYLVALAAEVQGELGRVLTDASRQGQASPATRHPPSAEVAS